MGEHPKAADTLGINVYLMRYVNVILGGMIAGVGGAYFTIGSVGRFDQDMTNGKGFIGLAAMIFGNWNPIGAYLASLLFGFADLLQLKMQILSIPIPSEFSGDGSVYCHDHRSDWCNWPRHSSRCRWKTVRETIIPANIFRHADKELACPALYFQKYDFRI